MLAALVLLSLSTADVSPQDAPPPPLGSDPAAPSYAPPPVEPLAPAVTPDAPTKPTMPKDREVNRLLIAGMTAAGTAVVGGPALFCCSGAFFFIPCVCAPIGAAGGVIAGMLLENLSLDAWGIAAPTLTALGGALILSGAIIGYAILTGAFNATIDPTTNPAAQLTSLGTLAIAGAGTVGVIAGTGAVAYFVAPATAPIATPPQGGNAQSGKTASTTEQGRTRLAMAY